MPIAMSMPMQFIFMNIISKLCYRVAVSKHSNLVFFGSGRVALPSLKLLAQNYPSLTVITASPPEQKKAANEVEGYCRANNLAWSSPINSRHDREKRKQEWSSLTSSMPKADFGVVCSYGYMLPKKFINLFSNGLIVVHPSLLPKYRGGSPIFHAIANGDDVSGVSYIQISVNKFDEGNLLHQVQTPISKTASYREIEQQLAELAAQHLGEVLDRIDQLRPGRSQHELAKSVPPQLQLAPIIPSHKLQLNRPAEVVYNWSRALQTPKVLFRAKQKEMILKFNPQYIQGEGEVGSFKVVGKRLYLRCSDRYIQVRTWYESGKMEQPPGIFIAQFIRSGKYPLEQVRAD